MNRKKLNADAQNRKKEFSRKVALIEQEVKSPFFNFQIFTKGQESQSNESEEQNLNNLKH